MLSPFGQKMTSKEKLRVQAIQNKKKVKENFINALF
jgi:hypothetical protein